MFGFHAFSSTAAPSEDLMATILASLVAHGFYWGVVRTSQMRFARPGGMPCEAPWATRNQILRDGLSPSSGAWQAPELTLPLQPASALLPTKRTNKGAFLSATTNHTWSQQGETGQTRPQCHDCTNLPSFDHPPCFHQTWENKASTRIWGNLGGACVHAWRLLVEHPLASYREENPPKPQIGPKNAALAVELPQPREIEKKTLKVTDKPIQFLHVQATSRDMSLERIRGRMTFGMLCWDEVCHLMVPIPSLTI